MYEKASQSVNSLSLPEQCKHTLNILKISKSSMSLDNAHHLDTWKRKSYLRQCFGDKQIRKRANRIIFNKNGQAWCRHLTGKPAQRAACAVNLCCSDSVSRIWGCRGHFNSKERSAAEIHLIKMQHTGSGTRRWATHLGNSICNACDRKWNGPIPLVKMM